MEGEDLKEHEQKENVINDEDWRCTPTYALLINKYHVG